MSERKVLNKYYPPDFDPSKVPRLKRKNKQNDVRTEVPFNMRCNTCGDYIPFGLKFNAKKETVEDETYHGLLVYRFYIKCKRCMAPITFKTNPKEKSYEVESGATENFKALKMAEQKALEEAEAEQEEEKIDPMKQLENRTKASRQQMEASEMIQQLRFIKHKYNSVDIDSVIQATREKGEQETRPAIASSSLKDDEIREEAKRLDMKRRIQAEKAEIDFLNPTLDKPGQLAAKKSSSSAMANLRKKIKVIPKSSSTSNDSKT